MICPEENLWKEYRKKKFRKREILNRWSSHCCPEDFLWKHRWLDHCQLNTVGTNAIFPLEGAGGG